MFLELVNSKWRKDEIIDNFSLRLVELYRRPIRCQEAQGDIKSKESLMVLACRRGLNVSTGLQHALQCSIDEGKKSMCELLQAVTR